MNTNTWRKWMISLSVTFGMLILVWFIGSVMAQEPPLPKKPVAARAVQSSINYQGMLYSGGSPVNGSQNMVFRLYSNDTCGAQIGADIVKNNVAVANGQFNVTLDVDSALFNGQALWLEVDIGGVKLGCEALLPTPYAFSLRPGAEITGEPGAADNAVLKTALDGLYPLGKAIWGTAATGSAIQGESTNGWALKGETETGYAVYGHDGGADQARGYGGYFTSDNGIALYGRSSAVSHYTNMYAPGVYGRSAYGAGVYGVGEGSVWPSYGGYFEGRTGIGVRGTGPASNSAYAASITSEHYRGIYAKGASGYYDAYFAGDTGIYSVSGYTTMRNSRTVVVNGGTTAIAPGDVVAISGVAKAPNGEMLLAVQKADAAHSAIVGVMVEAMKLEMIEVEKDVNAIDAQPVPGSSPPQGYLALVSSGLVAAVNVDLARSNAINIGDWLGVSTAPGRAASVGSAQGDDVALLGKAAGPVDVKNSTIPVFIILQ